MTYIITESRRDDLLLPYYEMVKQQFPELTLGQFKGKMLDKLAAQGGINNLSLSSNYYLAGATKYYFNGDLTINRKINFAGNDNWNEDVCKRLNALILILRDAYIDTVGTQFEQPEDFGQLSIAKLLRKYGKKIDAALGIVKTPEKKVELDENPNVGNGYTFDILYSYGDATKYNVYTRPGAWCITYGQHHYDYYINKLNIHYVIFLKKGYENVQRPLRPVNMRKPHDEYGNSMIAVLQSNSSWKPVYITSRWNHGYDTYQGVEADHAYTTEEFCNITGVTPEDLERIYKIWKEKAKNTGNEKRNATLEAKKEFIHKAKYAQMLINGGENPGKFFRGTKVLIGNRENPDWKKSVVVLRPKADYFGSDATGIVLIFDKGKIVFDAIGFNKGYRYAQADNLGERHGITNDNDNFKFRHYIVVSSPNGCYIYDSRKKQVVSVNGTKTFKYVPDSYWGYSDDLMGNNVFMEVKQTSKTIALINLRNGQPLKLPNGEYWFNDISFPSTRTRYLHDTECEFLNGDNVPLCEITYDESSGEKYFYSFTQNRFIKMPSVDQLFGENYSKAIYPHISNDTFGNGFVNITFSSSNRNFLWDAVTTPKAIYNKNLQRIYIGRFNSFESVEKSDKGNLISFKPKDSKTMMLDKAINQILTINGEYITGVSFHVYGYSRLYDKYKIHVLYCSTGNNKGFIYLYDEEAHAFLENPIGYPSKYLFSVDINSSFYTQAEYESGQRNIHLSNSEREKQPLLLCVNKTDAKNDYYHHTFFSSEYDKSLVELLNIETLKRTPIKIFPDNGMTAREPLITPVQNTNVNNDVAVNTISESDIKSMVKSVINEIYGRQQ